MTYINATSKNSHYKQRYAQVLSILDSVNVYHEKLAKQITDYAANHKFNTDDYYTSLGGKLYESNKDQMSSWPEMITKLTLKDIFCLEVIKTYSEWHFIENSIEQVAFSTHFSMAI